MLGTMVIPEILSLYVGQLIAKQHPGILNK